MRIDTFLTSYFPEKEDQFKNSIVIMVDVLRASTTVCSALYNGAKELIPVETTERAIQIYNNLSREIRFLGGERNGVKPPGFDGGNSPLEYTPTNVLNRTVILSTSNGTKIFQKAKNAKVRIIGSFTNLSSVLNYVYKIIGNEDSRETAVNFLCAGNNGRISYEDTICAGAFIYSLSRRYSLPDMTDTAHLAMNLFTMHANEIKEFLSVRDHAVNLKNLGFFEDINTCLTLDKYPVVPVFYGNIIKKSD